MKTTNKNVPKCIGIIMDGNRRWAREHNFPTLEGHRKGYEKLRDVLEWAKEVGIHHVVVYAFSTENWRRKKEEVEYLMDIFREMIRDFEENAKEDSAVRFVGQKERFPDDLQESMETLERKHPNARYTLWVALSYGGRAEILQAVKRMTALSQEEQLAPTEEEFSKHLWTAGMPDPDIIIRTSGEQRLSGFLPWQSVYSELFFIPEYWPDFSKGMFENILREYYDRERRRGK